MKFLRLVVLLGAFSLAGCVEEQGNVRPWTGYAWNFAQKRFEYFFKDYESYRDCTEMMKAQTVPGGENSQWYSEPVGCLYHGNSYWRVWLYNNLLDPKMIGCIRRTTSEYASKTFAAYSVQLAGDAPKTRTEDSYCM
jgi:hypothetical protein